MIAAAWVTVAVTASLTVIVATWALPHLPRTEDAPDYAALRSWPFATALAAVTAACAGVVTWTVPVTQWAPWIAFTSTGAVAVAIDARTTWLPRAVTRTGWLLTAAGVVVSAITENAMGLLLTAGLGALAVGAFFHGIWRMTGQIGYGDVRLMVTAGAVTALEGAQFMLSALLFGSLVGAVWGVVHRLRTRADGPFPYGPALFSGPYIALVVQALTS